MSTRRQERGAQYSTAPLCEPCNIVGRRCMHDNCISNYMQRKLPDVTLGATSSCSALPANRRAVHPRTLTRLRTYARYHMSHIGLARIHARDEELERRRPSSCSAGKGKRGRGSRSGVQRNRGLGSRCGRQLQLAHPREDVHKILCTAKHK